MSPSAFADRCGLSRSNLSQTLSGRNRSVNDVFLGRIKAAFPELDVSWLLFGPTDGRERADIEFSEPQNAAPEDDSLVKEIGPQIESVASEPRSPFVDQMTVRDEDPVEYMAERSPHSGGVAESSGRTQSPPRSVASTDRHPVRVIVLYSDGTFESFDPA